MIRHLPCSPFFALAAATTTAALILPTQAHALEIGDTAPLLTVKSFVKGKPVAPKLSPNQTYVVEFWATWCVPCKTSIPHLTDLQKKNPKVNFIGVSVLEDDQAGVKPFVASMGAKMGYTVAMDTAVGDKGFMAKYWCSAADVHIPTAFIVKSGKIAWIGHPMEIEEPLNQIQAGNWDIRSARTAHIKEKLAEKKFAALQQKISPYLQAGQIDKAIDVFDKAIAQTPSFEETIGMTKLNLLVAADKTDDAATYTIHLVDVLKNPQTLSIIAWNIVAPNARKKSPELYPVALKAAQKAVEITHNKNLDVLDTLAWAYFANGDKQKAMEIATKNVEMNKNSPDYAKTLAAFKKAQ
jgi:thiol-disulfide isomerase/thioredoxin